MASGRLNLTRHEPTSSELRGEGMQRLMEPHDAKGKGKSHPRSDGRGAEGPWVSCSVSATLGASKSSFPSTNVCLLLGGKRGPWWLPDSPPGHRALSSLSSKSDMPKAAGVTRSVCSDPHPGRKGHVLAWEGGASPRRRRGGGGANVSRGGANARRGASARPGAGRGCPLGT